MMHADEFFWVECYNENCDALVETACMETETEAVEAWNTRADSYKQAAEYWQRMFESSLGELTCEELGSIRVWQSCNVWSHELSCGHEVDTLEQEPPNYCPNCGAKVVGK